MTKNQKSKAPEWLFDNIAEISKNAGKIYILYLGFLTYCALTVIVCSDRQIILNEEIRLPIVNIDISFNGFFILAPLIAILIFSYLQLYLQRLRTFLIDLDNDYAPVNKKRLYPSIINIAEYPEPALIGKIQRFVVQLTLWWALPAVLTLFAFWYIKKHDPILSYIIGVAPTLGLGVVLYFRHKYERGETKIRFNLKTLFRLIGIFVFQIVLTFLIFLSLRGFGINVDLSYEILIEEPEKPYKTYWANLHQTHLEGANLTGAILNRANLRGAYLQLAHLSGTQLQEADLSGAQLQSVYLREAQLQGANLREAVLLQADLTEALLDSADLTNARLEGALVNASQLSRVKTLYGAQLDLKLQQEIQAKHPYVFRKIEAPIAYKNPFRRRMELLVSYLLKLSDERLKDVKGDFTRGLDAIDRLNPVYYNYKKDNPIDLPSDEEYVGLIAQDVQKVIPEAVREFESGYLLVNNDPIIWTMLNAIKELRAEKEVTKVELDQAESELNEMKTRVAELESLLQKLVILTPNGENVSTTKSGENKVLANVK